MSIEAEPRVLTEEEIAAIEECHKIALDSAQRYFGVDREDLIQSTSLRIADRVSRGGIPGGHEFEPRAYTRRVMTNTLINMLNRGGKGHPGETPTDADFDFLHSPAASAEDEFMSTVLSGDLQDALDTMNPTHRAIIWSREVEGLSVEETADAVGVAFGTVLSGSARARSFVRAQLAESTPADLTPPSLSVKSESDV